MTDQLPPPRIDLLVHAPSPASLVPVLEQLLEPSPPLSQLLAPQLHSHLQQLPPSNRPKSYLELIEISQKLVERWDVHDQADFVQSHPRIGEQQGLSRDSQEEQAGGGIEPTSGHVLRRLTMLNAFYEETFPGLRFITFVNGRTRAEIVPEIESILSLSLPPPSSSSPEPRFTSLRQQVKIQPFGTQRWRGELERCLEGMWEISKDRLRKRGIK